MNDSRGVFSRRFRGFLTDFEQFLAVQRWMVKAKRLTPVPDEIDRRIQVSLLEQDLKSLHRLMDVANDPAHALLERLIDTSVSTGGTMEERIEWFEQRAETAGMVGALARQIGLFDRTPLVSLHAAATIAETMRDAAAGIASNQVAR